MLYDKLKNYSKSGIYPFHMPGHKRTDITEEGIIPYNIDITEIHDFDNLHSPNGVIDEIQKKAAKLYNAKNAFILINGSTGGILSGIRSMTNQGIFRLNSLKYMTDCLFQIQPNFRQEFLKARCHLL